MDITITTHVTLYAPWEDGADDREELDTTESVQTIEPDEDETPAIAVASVIWSAGAWECSSYPAGTASAHDWYTEQYEHPYTGELRETSLHMSGADWTDAVAADVSRFMAMTPADWRAAQRAAEAEAEAARLAAGVAGMRADIAAERFGYDLVYVDRGDRLSDEQIDAYLNRDGADAYLDDDLDEWVSDRQYESAIEILQGLATDNGIDWDDIDSDVQDDLRFAVYDRDASDPVRDLARETPAQLFRVTIADGFDYLSLMNADGYRDATRAIVTPLAAAGMRVTDAFRYAREVLPECGDSLHDGFTLDVIWFGDIETVAGVSEGDTLTFTNPEIVLLDRLNGAGMEGTAAGTVTVQLTAGDMPHLDRTGFGYGWDAVAGVSMSYYRAEPAVTRVADMPAARLEYLRGEIAAERISQSEIIELQGLAAHIDPGDIDLLQWAGVPEFPDDDTADDDAPAQCNVLFCIGAPSHDGDHYDVTGHSWSAPTPAAPVIAHVISFE